MLLSRNKKRIFLFAATSLFAVGFFVIGAAVFAQAPGFGLEYGDESMLGRRDIRETIFQIINVILGILGIVALGIVIYGGYAWMTANGEEEKVRKAKKILTNAVIGLAIILSSFAIVQFILSKLGEATGALEPCDTMDATEECVVGGCTGTRRCEASGYWGSCDVGSCIPGSGPYFYITNTSPKNSETNVIRNKVIRVTFNREPSSGTVTLGDSFILEKTSDGIDVTDSVPSTVPFTVNGRVLEFIPNDDVQCTTDINGTIVDVFDQEGNPVYGCLEANTEYTLKLEAGAIVSVGNHPLECPLSQPCEIVFTTGSIIDIESPQVAISSSGQFCVDTVNDVTAAGGDDAGIDYVNFKIDGGKKAQAPTDSDTSLVQTGEYPNITFNATWKWNTGGSLGYSAGMTYGLSATAYDVDNHNTTSGIRNVTLRSAHCCNLTQDVDEQGVDCGGADCASCTGAQCDLGDTDPNTCLAPDNYSCYSNYCDIDSCTCLEPPIIDAIEPVDANGVPIGTSGNLFTIWGRHFGDAQGTGKVVFLGNDPDIDLDGDGAVDNDDKEALLPKNVNAKCTDTWSDSQIIMVVPSGANDGPIQVVANNDLSDVTSDLERGSVLPDFDLDPSYSLPGICKLDPSSGEFTSEGTEVDIYGVKFDGFSNFANDPNDTILFGADTEAYNRRNWKYTSSIELFAFVPNLANGIHTVRVVADSKKSNGANFQIGIPENMPTILSVDPDNGGVGQYVTLSGANFGDTAGTVYFYNSKDGCSVLNRSSSCTAVADVIFPEQCSENWWRDSQIIVKVPVKYLDNTTTLDPDDLHGIYLVTSLALESNAVDFDVTNSPPGPGLCLLVPESGDAGIFISAYGEYFGTTIGFVEFYKVKVADVTGPWDQEEINNIQVPDGAVSGPVYIYENKTLKKSNPLNFTVGACAGDEDCISGSYCCNVGLYAGSCLVQSMECSEIVDDFYTWPFSTSQLGVSTKVPPKVVKDSSCTDGDLQSPTPNWENQTNVCVNVAASARFDQDMDDASLTAAGYIKLSLLLKCTDANNNGAFESSECNNCSESNFSSCNSSQTVTTELIIDSYSDGAEGFTLYPGSVSNSSYLEENTWYQVLINDTVKGENGASLDGDGNGYEGGDYSWTFKTKSSASGESVVCQPDHVEVMPKDATINIKGGTKLYTSAAVSKECFVLTGNEWKWMSTSPQVATITNSNAPNQTATAVNEGETDIQATETKSSLYDTGHLTVSFADLEVVGFWPNCESACQNAEIGAQFNMGVKEASLLTTDPANDDTDRVVLYECGNSECQWPDLKIITLYDVPVGANPSKNASYYTSEDFSLHISSQYLKHNQSGSLVAYSLKNNTYYRVILGGEIIAWNGTTLSKKNFSLGTGEDCDDGNLNTEDGCSDKCVNEGSLFGGSTCGNSKLETGEDCDDGNSAVGDGCDANCLHEGSNFANRCGNSVVDNWEDCDDGNLENSDGCSSRCLKEGSSPSASSVPICGDGRVDIGEECDGGNTDNGDGCSDRCLNEGVSGGTCGNGNRDSGEECDDSDTNTGDGCSDRCLNEGTNHAACGNSKLETGEDCDDGNTTDGDGCAANCQNKGSKGNAVCGNGIVEGGESDAFSWIFKVGDNPEDCYVNRVTISPKDYVSTLVGEVHEYYTYPYTKPDECSADGQRLDSWAYDWTWQPSDVGSIDELLGLNWEVAQIHNPVTLDYYPVDTDSDGDIDPEQEAIAIGDGALDANFQQTTPIGTKENETDISCVENGGECGQFTIQCGFQNDSDCLKACDAEYRCVGNRDWACTSSTQDVDCVGLLCDTENNVCVSNPEKMCTSDADCQVCDTARRCVANEKLACTQDIECAGVGYNTCCVQRPAVESVSPSDGATDVCRNAIIEANFDQEMDTASLKGNVILERNTVGVNCAFAENSISWWSKIARFFGKLFGKATHADTWCAATGSSSYRTNSAGNTTLAFTSSDYMEKNTQYRVTILGDDNLSDDATDGVRNEDGVAMNGDYQWQFITGEDVCDIDYVEVTIYNNGAGQSGEISDSDLFSCYSDPNGAQNCPDDYNTITGGNQHYYFAQAKDLTNVAVFGLNGIDYSWKESDAAEAIELSSAFSEQDQYVANAPKEDEQAIVMITADGTDDDLGAASANIDVRIFLCNNPWPDFDHFPFEDKENNCASDAGAGLGCSDYHFETYYCRDRGDVNSASDDLPALVYQQATNNTCTSGDCVVVSGKQNNQTVQEELLKEFFYLRTDGSKDAIGIRIYENSHGYSPTRWYNENVPNPGAPQNIVADGYEAVRDGRTVYAAATNQVAGSPAQLYTNIYLITYSEGADNDTVEVFNQMLDNWHFNTNVDNIQQCVSSIPDIDPQLKWEWPGTDAQAQLIIEGNTYSFRHIMSIPAVADLDTDGDLEMVVNTFSNSSTYGSEDYGDPHYHGFIRVLDAATGVEDTSFVKNAFAYPVNPDISPAVGDLDGDGDLEIVAGWSQSALNKEKGLVVFEHDGTAKWTNSDIVMMDTSAGRFGIPTLTDINQDGRAEVIIGDWIFDGATGERFWTESAIDAYSTTNAPKFSVAIDLDPARDGLELITGDKVYYSNGEKKWDVNSSAVYIPAVVEDLTQDGVAEIVRVSWGTLELINGKDGSRIGNAVALPSNYGGGPPVVADFFGDGGVYAGVYSKDQFAVYSISQSGFVQKWAKGITDSGSSKNGASAFDFNSDGAYEILLQDNGGKVYVLNGRDGTTLWSKTNYSETLLEYPFVVDLDNDDIGELVVAENCYWAGCVSDSGGGRVYEQDDAWAEARSIWNQYQYFITNVNDDGTIPTVQENPWDAGYDSFRAQEVLGEISNYCSKDDECPGSLCNADRDKLVRDTKRLADLREMQILANQYNSSHASFPSLSAGTYVPGVSFSVWPSWSGTLAPELGGALYGDPVNKFYGCEDPYDPTTCWNEQTKQFYCPELAYVYGYQTQSEGDIGKFYMTMEYAHDFAGSFAGNITSQCADTIDNDGDGKTDFGKDDGCIDSFDNTELDTAPNYYNSAPQCGDGVDNDSDGKIDFGGSNPDPGCVQAYDDTEENGAANVCLSFYGTVENDYDADGVADSSDNCYSTPNPEQQDADGDKVGDVCDECPSSALNDQDNDDLCEDEDNCVTVYNPGQEDHSDPADGVGDACDSSCTGDSDSDGDCDEVDNCPTKYNSDQLDTDGDGLGDVCDPCPTGVDPDEDGVCGEKTFTVGTCSSSYSAPVEFGGGASSYDLAGGGTAYIEIPPCTSLDDLQADLLYNGTGMSNAYIVFSIDTSGSMYTDPVGSDPVPIDGIINLLGSSGTIIDDIFNKATDAKIKMIAWGSMLSASTENCTYTNYNGTSGSYCTSPCQNGFCDQSQKNVLKAFADNLTNMVAGATTLELGLQTAVDSLKNNTPAGAQKILIYLTDAGSGGGQTEYTTSLEGKENSQAIYTILYVTSDTLKEFMCQISSNYPSSFTAYNATANCISQYSSNGYAFESTSATLGIALSDIVKKIGLSSALLDISYDSNTYTTNLNSLSAGVLVPDQNFNIDTPSTGSGALGSKICGDQNLHTISLYGNFVSASGAFLNISDLSLSYCPYFLEASGDGDNCPNNYNPDQSDGDNDGIGDACDTCFDADHDNYGEPGYDISECTGSTTQYDNCPGNTAASYDASQQDNDGDGIGTICDPQECGNDSVEGGEQCDEGTGTYITDGGTSQSNQYECSGECSYTGGWCGDTIIQTTFERCDTTAGAGTNSGDEYECTADCEWDGGYCGDSIAQTDYREWCDMGEAGGIISSLDNEILYYDCGDGTIVQNSASCASGTGKAITYGYDSNHQYACTQGTSVGEGGCQQTGGWCGDGIVQNGTGGTANYGEECDEGVEIITAPSDPVHIVFALDTSGSMIDEWGTLCNVVQNVINELEVIAEIKDIKYKIYSFHSDSQVGTPSCLEDNVGGSNNVYSTCNYSFTYTDDTDGSSRTINGPITNHYEDSGPAVTDISYCEEWKDGYVRIIVPITDEGFQDGCDWDTYDTSSVNTAYAAANANNVFVVPIYDDGWCGHFSEVDQLAKNTGASGAIEYSNIITIEEMACYIKRIIYEAQPPVSLCDENDDGYMDCREREYEYLFEC